MACCAKKEIQVSQKVNSKDRKFVPKYSERGLTEKFYSKYENIDSTVAISDDIAKDIENYQKHDRRAHYYAPVTENQVYGWYCHLANRYTWDENDFGIVLHPRKTDEMITQMTTVNVGTKRLGIK